MEIVIKGNIFHSHHVEGGLPQGSPISHILFAILTAGLAMWVEVRVECVEGLSFISDLGGVSTRKDVSQVVKKLEAYTAESTQWASW
jgi:hypothetical protein